MKACEACQQQNPEEAQFCHRCGQAFSGDEAAAASESLPDEEQLLEILIGPNKSLQFAFGHGWSWRPAAEYYLAVFRRFTRNAGPSGVRFTLTWNWPAFLFDPFLWFLYRKMYMYALIYAVGPVVSVFLTGDMSVGIVWRLMAGASANYLYFWHLKDHLRKITSRAGLDRMAKMRLLQEEGGVQAYVLWLGVALHLLMFGVLLATVEEGPPPDAEFFQSPPDSDQKFF